MSRLKALMNDEADAKVQTMFAGVEKKLGMVPNLMRTLGHSSAALEAYLGFSTALTRGSLPARLREQIALVVGETNQCQYCLAAHATLGQMAGLTDDEVTASRRGSSTDRKTRAALFFARKIVVERGQVTDDDVEGLRSVGFSDGDIAEIVAHVAMNIFTNYFNHVAGTEVDFPEVQRLEASTSCAC